MAEIIKMPRLSDTMEEGTVAKWHKEVGDEVKNGEVLADIETDKATMEFESFLDGVLLHKGVQEGETASVDVILAVIGEEGEDIQELLEQEKKGAQEAEKASEEEKASSEKESSPSPEPAASTPTPSTGDGKEKAAPSPSTAPAPAPSPSSSAGTALSGSSTTPEGRVKASPLARKLAKEKGVDLRMIEGTGYEGRIVKRDVEQFRGGGMMTTAPVQEERYQDVEVSQMRKTIAKRLAESKFTAPHFYLTLDIDMEQAIRTRKSINERIAPSKISYNDLIVKASAQALKEHPQVNASWTGEAIRFYDHVHVGVAVAVEEGLLVPVVRFADGKPLTAISEEVKEFAKKAQNKELQPQDWEGNTFTISNLGMYDIEEFTAIINPPDSCIMAVGSIKEEPVVKEGQIVPGNRMRVTLSCDHRVVDGATGAAFLQTFKRYMEDPVLFLGAPSI